MVNHSPLVSVVLPVYNGASFLAEAIDSVLRQTYRNIEVIVVDDGSTDGGATAEVARRFGDLVRYVRKPNGGVASAMNLGVELMKGEFFSWLSHDDLYEPEKIEVQVETWRRFGRPCVVFGDYDVIDEHGRHLFTVDTNAANLLARPLDGVLCAVLNGCALLIPRELFEQVGLFETGLPQTQDYELWFRMARAVPFIRSPGSLVRYRSHPLQGSRQEEHLEQVSRLISHFVDSISFDEMVAYDGSPLRFLLRVRRRWFALAGARNAIDRRLTLLLRGMSFAVVLLGGEVETLAGMGETLAAFRPAPCNVVHLSFDDGDPATTADWTGMIDRACSIVAADVLAFLSVDARQDFSNLSATLAEIAAGADLVRPEDHADRPSPLDGLVVRRQAVPALRTALAYGNTNLHGLSPVCQQVPFMPPNTVAEDVTAAVNGGLSLNFEAWHHKAGVEAIRRRLSAHLPTMLLIGHRDGEGCAVHAKGLAALLRHRANCLFLRGDDGLLTLSSSPEPDGSGLCFDLPRQISGLTRLLRALDVAAVDVHQVKGFENAAEALLQALGLPYDLTLTDHHLLTEQRTAQTLGMFARAQRVIAVSRSLARDAAQSYPTLRILCACPIRVATEQQHVFLPKIWEGEPLRLLVAGATSPRRGLDILLSVAHLIKARRLPIELHATGATPLSMSEWKALDGVLFLHGAVDGDRFGETVIGIGPHAAWFPAQEPEANILMLARVMTLGFPILASAIGSVPERCDTRPFTWLLPGDSGPDEWVALFLRLHAAEMRLPSCGRFMDNLPDAVEFYPETYLAPMHRRLEEHDAEQLGAA